MIKDLLNDPETPATVLNILLVDNYGAQCYNWELETIYLSLIEDFKLTHLNSFIRDKIGAIITLNTSERFYQQWEVFEDVCKAFNHEMIHFEDLTPLSVEELAWGLVEAKLNDETFSKLSGDVMAYCQTVLKSEGVSNTPDFLTDIISYKSYNEYDKEIEESYQLRIKAYVLLNLEKISKISTDYFNFNFLEELKKEFPYLSKYLS